MNHETNRNLAAEVENIRSIVYYLSESEITDICNEYKLILDSDVKDKHSALVIAIANLEPEQRNKILNEIDLKTSKHLGTKI